MSNQTEDQRLADIRQLLETGGPATRGENNQAFGWKEDCRYLLQIADDARNDRDELVDTLRNWIGHCPDCEGYGADVLSDESEKPCDFCQPARRLIERLRPAPPTPAPAIEELENDYPF